MIFSMTCGSAQSIIRYQTAYIDLPRLVRLDLLSIPDLLIRLTCLEVDIILQSKLDKKIIVA
jgi:hypothetical protein